MHTMPLATDPWAGFFSREDATHSVSIRTFFVEMTIWSVDRMSSFFGMNFACLMRTDAFCSH